MNCPPLQNTACGFADTSAIPSRHDNPFATCWTRPGAIGFRFSNGQCAAQLVAKLAAQSWWGAIVGPHGSGKSTLLETLKPALSAAGMRVQSITLRDRQRRLRKDFFLFDREGGRPLIIVDGYEQLGWIERVRLKRRCRRSNVGLLITCHSSTSIPTLIRLAPDRRLVEQLVADLAARAPTGVVLADVIASHACRGSNVREIFFDLYDRHERRRPARSRAAGRH